MSVDTAIGVREKRDVWTAIKKGLKCRCPNCGEGKLFRKYIKSVDQCAVCKTEIHHHRADDFPPYLTIFIVGHIVITLVMIVEAKWDISTFAHLAMWVPLTVTLSLAMLQPLKGGVIGMQWALRMHGFGGNGETE